VIGRAPVRTCVGCRDRAAKSELLRVVRTPEATVRVDPDATAQGRGAYVHPRAVCLDAAEDRGAFARALRTGVGPEEARKLRDIVESIEERA
jgi:predicted RNA-binding protein YlxR (DUF448 family)